jgi:hypothetical protein
MPTKKHSLGQRRLYLFLASGYFVRVQAGYHPYAYHAEHSRIHLLLPAPLTPDLQLQSLPTLSFYTPLLQSSSFPLRSNL